MSVHHLEEGRRPAPESSAEPGRRRPVAPPGALIAWGFVLPWLLWAVWRVVERPTRWPAPAIIAFTPYVAAAALVPVAVALVLRRRLAATVALAVAVALTALVVPRQVGATQPAADGPVLTVGAANVSMGAADASALLASLAEHDVDVVVAVELNRWMVASLEAAGVDERYPYAYLDPRGGGRGAGVWSRWPVRFLDDPSRDWDFAAPRVAVDGPDGTTIEVVAVHPHAPRTPTGANRWRRALAALPPARPDALRILAGDFNATLDHRELRRLLGTGYVDAADQVGAGLVWTWPADGTLAPPVTIDHVLVDRRIAVRDFTTFAVPGSDHRGVASTVQLPSSS